MVIIKTDKLINCILVEINFNNLITLGTSFPWVSDIITVNTFFFFFKEIQHKQFNDHNKKQKEHGTLKSDIQMLFIH